MKDIDHLLNHSSSSDDTAADIMSTRGDSFMSIIVEYSLSMSVIHVDVKLSHVVYLYTH